MAGRETTMIPGSTKREKVRRNREKPVRRYRFTVQLAFVLLCIWIGIEFHFFVKYVSSGGKSAFISRPPGVDGFLPISSMMSLYYTFLTGHIHAAHPAGLFILIAILLMSLVFGKTFCSWLCPVGFMSENVGDLGEKLFGRRLKIPGLLDYPLRCIKYLLLAFFLYSIFVLLDAAGLRAFLDSPYNLVADIKMYYFFADISRFALTAIAVLIVLSVIIRNFWCRYLCPYGALLGLLSLLSPFKIKRNATSCIDCGKCAKVCPSNIKVDKVLAVFSDECTTCLACVDSCHIAETLEVKPLVGDAKIPKKVVGFVTVLIFVCITGLGMLTGHWHNNITPEEYILHRSELRSYGHPTSLSDVKKLDESANWNGEESE
jgi:polyferredoxin